MKVNWGAARDAAYITGITIAVLGCINFGVMVVTYMIGWLATALLILALFVGLYLYLVKYRSI